MNFSKLKLLVIVIFASIVLSACGALPTSSWPGVAVSSKGDFVYVAYATGVYKVDATNGSMAWRYPDKADAAKQFYAAPGISDSLVVVGDYGNALFGLDSGNGAEKWTNTDAKDKWIAGMLIVDKAILAPSADGNLYSLSLDGKVNWKFTANADFWANPVSDGKTVYVPSMDHFLYAINLSDGKLVWKTDLGASGVYGLALGDDGTIYLSTLADEVLAIRADGRSIVWRFKPKGSVWAVPVVKDGIVYIGDLNNKVYAISASNGQSKWEVDAPGPVLCSPAVTPNGLVFASETGAVFMLDFNGKLVWNKTINGKLYSAPVIAGQQVIVGITSGDKDVLLATYDFTGKDGWTFTAPK
jgi:outer membrane protein assembly factor BamB